VHFVPDSLKDGGKVMLFNNGVFRNSPNLYSSVHLISLPFDETTQQYLLANNETYLPSQFDWSYRSNWVDPLFSYYIGSVQRLPNGNTLICEGATGELIEIDANEKKVWQYRNPVGIERNLMVGNFLRPNDLFGAHKYGKNYSAFEDKTLEEGSPLHLCKVWFTAYPNPCKEGFWLYAKEEEPATIQVFNAIGQRMYQNVVPLNIATKVDVNTWQNGVYYVKVQFEQSEVICYLKIIKM